MFFFSFTFWQTACHYLHSSYCMKFRMSFRDQLSIYHHFLTDCQSFDGRLTTSDNFLLLLLLSPLPPSPFCWAKMIAPSSNAGSPSDDVTRPSNDVTRTSDSVCWKSCLGSNLSASSLSFFAAFETFFTWRWKSCSDSRLKEIRHLN